MVDGHGPPDPVRARLPAGPPVQGARARQPLAEARRIAVEEEGPGAVAAAQPRDDSVAEPCLRGIPASDGVPHAPGLQEEQIAVNNFVDLFVCLF